MPTRVFVSHSTRDEKQVKGVILQALEAAQVDEWYAPQSIRAGDDWPRKIEKAIPASDVVLLVVSEAAAASTWVHTEIGIARVVGCPVVPVRIDDTRVGDVYEGLATTQHLDALQGADVKELGSNLGTLLRDKAEEAEGTRIKALPEGLRAAIPLRLALRAVAFGACAALLVLLLARHGVALPTPAWPWWSAGLATLAGLTVYRTASANLRTPLLSWLQGRAAWWVLGVALVLLVFLNLGVASLHVRYVPEGGSAVLQDVEVRAADVSGSLDLSYRLGEVDDAASTWFWPLFSRYPSEGRMRLERDLPIPQATQDFAFGWGSVEHVVVPAQMDLRFHALYVVTAQKLYGDMQDSPETSGHKLRIVASGGEELLPPTPIGRKGPLLIGAARAHVEACWARTDQKDAQTEQHEQVIRSIGRTEGQREVLRAAWAAEPQVLETTRPLGDGEWLQLFVLREGAADTQGAPRATVTVSSPTGFEFVLMR